MSKAGVIPVTQQGRILFILLTAIAPASFAQIDFNARWQEIGANQPAGVKLAITAPKTQFYFGEVIPLRLTFTASVPERFVADTRLQDRVGRINWVEEFVVTPDSTEDPLQGLQGGTGGMGGLSGGPIVLSESPFTFERILNDWVRFRQVGQYRVYVISRRVRAVHDGSPEHSKPFDLVSNVLTLTISAAPPTWTRQQIEEAKQALSASATNDAELQKRQVQARRVLRFLNSPDAAEELVLALTAGQDVDAFMDYAGVLGSPFRARLLPFMERRLIAAGQAVSERYLETLAQLAGRVGKQPAAAREPEQAHYAAELASSLSGKEPAARAVCFTTLVNFASRANPEPAWMPNLRKILAANFRSLPPATQSTLLESQWNTWKSPEVLPALRVLIANPPRQYSGSSVQSLALRRLYEESPLEGRRIVIDEIRRPTTFQPFETLAMLPDESLPELNDLLASRFDQLMILRYATGGVVKRVEEEYLAHRVQSQKQNLPSCAGPLAFYFLKYDPPFGERLLREDFAKVSTAPACYDIGFQLQSLGRWAFSPALERFAIESLSSPKVPVKRGAAEILRRFGSTEAQKPLWETLEYFRSWWKGRELELKEKTGEEGMQFELALRGALGRADAWVLDETQLKRLMDLCSSDWCRADVNEWIAAAGKPVQITASQLFAGKWNYTLAQYGPGDEEWLRRKLIQFPRDTPFQVGPGARGRAIAVVEAAGRSVAESR